MKRKGAFRAFLHSFGRSTIVTQRVEGTNGETCKSGHDEKGNERRHKGKATVCHGTKTSLT